MNSRTYVRIGLLALAGGQIITGAWAVLAPQHWFTSFPPGRPGWVAVHEPFNQHLVADAGTAFLATGVALLLAALWPSARIVFVAVAAYIAHALPHLVYHLGHPAHDLPAVDQTLSWLPMAGGIVVAVFVAWLATKPPRGPVVTSDGGSDIGAAVSLVSARSHHPLLIPLFAVVRRQLGIVPDSWRALGRVPTVLFGRACGDAVHAQPRHVPEQLAAMATLRAATLVECEFCIDIGSAITEERGIDDRKIQNLARWSESDAFNDTERLVLELTDAMTKTPAVMPSDLVRRLIVELGEEGVIELAATIGHENARARTNRALGVPSQGFATTD